MGTRTRSNIAPPPSWGGDTSANIPVNALNVNPYTKNQAPPPLTTFPHPPQTPLHPNPSGWDDRVIHHSGKRVIIRGKDPSVVHSDQAEHSDSNFPGYWVGISPECVPFAALVAVEDTSMRGESDLAEITHTRTLASCNRSLKFRPS